MFAVRQQQQQQQQQSSSPSLHQLSCETWWDTLTFSVIPGKDNIGQSQTLLCQEWSGGEGHAWDVYFKQFKFEQRFYKYCFKNSSFSGFGARRRKGRMGIQSSETDD